MTPTIEAHGLIKRYGKTTALDGLDLVAERGQVVAVLGPNGAGKTTFVRTVATLLRPDAGTLRVAGHDVRTDPAAVRRIIGLAGQFAAIEPAMTGRENLEMVARLFGQDRRAAQRSASTVLEQLGLVDAADRLARTYSGGMRRRLDLGASLVGAPRLLLLDEPTTGLDPRSRMELWDAIRALVEGGTDVLLTTQYLDEADHLATQVVIVDRRAALRYLRTPQLLVLGTIQGVGFLLVYRYVFGGAIDVGGVAYVDFLVPGFVVTGVLFMGIGAAVAMAEDLQQGFVDRLRSLPIPRGSVLA